MHPADPKHSRKASCRYPVIVLGACLLLLVCASRLQATTVAQYRERIGRAVILLDRLEAEDAKASEAGEPDTLAATFEKVRLLLPVKETVAATTGSWEVNNLWLHQSLSECEKGPVGPQRLETLNRITARLQALGVRLNELDNASPTDSASRYQNKARLEEILRRSEYQKKPTETGLLARWWQRLMKWLSSLFPKTEPTGSGTGAAAVSQVAQIFVVLLALAVIGYVVWKFAPRLLRSRGARKKPKREARIILGERLEPDQTAGDLLAAAEALARMGDLRAAIRKGYIALLCELGDRKLIRLAQHKTNRDYLGSVSDIKPLHEEMRKLTRSFESHWYGLLPAAEIDWASFRNGYHKALSYERDSHSG
jgi:hypothetical protein